VAWATGGTVDSAIRRRPPRISQQPQPPHGVARAPVAEPCVPHAIFGPGCVAGALWYQKTVFHVLFGFKLRTLLLTLGGTFA
jgi:hypothetical protein